MKFLLAVLIAAVPFGLMEMVLAVLTRPPALARDRVVLRPNRKDDEAR